MKYDYLIIGQGLAGTLLAFELLKNHQRILIVDTTELSAASHVAVGLYNPVVLKKIEKSWLVDELIPILNECYLELEQLLGVQLHFKKAIVKIFNEPPEITLWEKRLKEEVGKYMDTIQTPEELEPVIQAGLGFAQVNQAGYVDVQALLIEARKYFEQLKCIAETVFNLTELTFTEEGVHYKNCSASTIVFCEGHLVSKNPYFNWLPLNPSKGEVLIIEIDKLYTTALLQIADRIINKGVFIVPISTTVFKIGATYSWKELNELPTDSGKEELLQKLKKILKLPFTIIDHKAAVRPNVHDRRPLIGLHPENRRIGIFNGLGSKGVLLAPYFARQFTAFLLKGEALHPEADIKRCYKKYKSVSIIIN